MSTSRSALQWIETHHVALVGAVFAVHLLVGLAIFDDYGVHMDEMNNQRFGKRWYQYCIQVVSERSLHPPPETRVHDYVHGPSFELLLVALEKAAGLEDSRPVILMRHAAVFVLFHIGSICFFFLCQRLFGSWHWGLLGFFFLVLHPRIFAHAFYNSVDLPFLSVYIIAMLTAIKLLDDNTLRAAVLHAVVCALLITVRSPGALVALCTFMFLVADFLVLGSTRLKQLLLNGAVYGLLLTLLVYLMWPLLWSNPLATIVQAGEHTKFVTDTPPPWLYSFVWIGVTTPLLIVGLFLTGFGLWTFSAAQDLGDSPKSLYRQHRLWLLLMLLLVVPLFLPILLETRLFDGWRHHFFVYPVIVVFSLYGAQTVFRNFRGRFERARLTVAAIVLIIGLGPAVMFIVRSHPHQQVYANALAGENLEYARANDSLDYWSVSYRQLIEHLLDSRKGRPKLSAPDYAAKWNLLILPPEQRQRVRITRQLNRNVRFFVTNFRNGPPPFPLGDEVYSIEVDGEKISALYEQSR